MTLDSTAAREWAASALARAKDAGASIKLTIAEQWLDRVEPIEICLLRAADYARWCRVRDMAAEQFAVHAGVEAAWPALDRT
jgi:hypothetical protein